MCAENAGSQSSFRPAGVAQQRVAIRAELALGAVVVLATPIVLYMFVSGLVRPSSSRLPDADELHPRDEFPHLRCEGGALTLALVDCGGVADKVISAGAPLPKGFQAAVDAELAEARLSETQATSMPGLKLSVPVVQFHPWPPSNQRSIPVTWVTWPQWVNETIASRIYAGVFQSKVSRGRGFSFLATVLQQGAGGNFAVVAYDIYVPTVSHAHLADGTVQK